MNTHILYGKTITGGKVVPTATLYGGATTGEQIINSIMEVVDLPPIYVPHTAWEGHRGSNREFRHMMWHMDRETEASVIYSGAKRFRAIRYHRRRAIYWRKRFLGV